MIVELTRPNLLYVVFRRKRIILATLALTVGLALLYCIVASSRYKAEASLVVNFAAAGVPGSSSGGQNDRIATPLDHEEIINTNVLLLESPQLARDVLNEIGIDVVYPAKTSLNPLVLVSRLFASDDADAREHALELSAARFVKKDLVVTGTPRSNLISLAVFNQDPTVAARVADRLIDRYLQREALIARNPRLDFIRGQLEIYKNQAADAQATLQQFKSTKNIYSLGEETTELIKERSLVEQSLLGAENRLVESQHRYEALKGQLANISPVVVTDQSDRDPMQLTARSNLADLQAQEAKLRNTFREDSEAVRDIRIRIGFAKAILASAGGSASLTHAESSASYQQIQVAMVQAKAEADAAKQGVETQRAQLERINQRFLTRSGDESAYHNAVRDNDLADQNYRTYLQGVQEARVSDDLNKQRISSIAVFDPPYASSRPAGPKRLLILLASLIGGFGFGLLLALLVESLDETLNTPAQVKMILGLPVVGSMPAV